jgi:hypothetical protein
LAKYHSAKYHSAKCYSAECRFAKCVSVKCHFANIILLNVILLNVVLLNVIPPNIILLNVIHLYVIHLYVILQIVGPPQQPKKVMPVRKCLLIINALAYRERVPITAKNDLYHWSHVIRHSEDFPLIRRKKNLVSMSSFFYPSLTAV